MTDTHIKEVNHIYREFNYENIYINNKVNKKLINFSNCSK